MATSAQRSQFRRYFNDSAGAIWSDEDIDAIYDEATEDYSDAKLIRIQARIIGIDDLRMNAAKQVTYKQNASAENRSDIFKHLSQMRGDLVNERTALENESLGAARFKPLGKRSKYREYPD